MDYEESSFNMKEDCDVSIDMESQDKYMKLFVRCGHL